MHAIISGYELPLLGTHGLSHWARVLDNGLRLADSTGANPAVVAHFAVFHDARRVDEGTDPGHGRRGAELARMLRGEHLNLTDEEFRLLEIACIHHTDGTVDGDVTVRTCWDADRLDLWRVCIEPKNEFLCTDAAKDAKIQEWARGRSVKEYAPDYVRENWLRGTRF
ncbi:MAG: hypothetical protein HKN20_10080 [Gemmatimonadetes bacterium]|nr:hypothetical protein [Gemmatimonadota bacterium]